MIIDLRDFIRQDRIVFPHETKKAGALRHLIEKAADLGLVSDKAAFEMDVIERETMTGTGIGSGVAIPHGRCRGAEDFFIITGIAGRPIQWQAIDHAPVRAIFLFGLPESRFTEKEMAGRYLEILSALMLLIKDPVRRKALFAAAAPQDVLAVLFEPAGQGSFVPD